MPSSTHDTFFRVLTSACAETRRGFDRQVGLSQPQRQLLTLLAAEREIRHATIRKQLGIDGAAVTHLVKGLESRGIVRRRLDPHDNRFTLASLTEAGNDLAGDLQTAHRQFQRQLLTGVDRGDLETTTAVLERLRANVTSMA